MDEGSTLGGFALGIIVMGAITAYYDPTHESFTRGCLAADPNRVVIEIAGKQRCLTQEQAKAVK